MGMKPLQASFCSGEWIKLNIYIGGCCSVAFWQVVHLFLPQSEKKKKAPFLSPVAMINLSDQQDWICYASVCCGLWDDVLSQLSIYAYPSYPSHTSATPSFPVLLFLSPVKRLRIANDLSRKRVTFLFSSRDCGSVHWLTSYFWDPVKKYGVG